jgi:hypothetical protein
MVEAQRETSRKTRCLVIKQMGPKPGRNVGRAGMRWMGGSKAVTGCVIITIPYTITGRVAMMELPIFGIKIATYWSFVITDWKPLICL